MAKSSGSRTSIRLTELPAINCCSSWAVMLAFMLINSFLMNGDSLDKRPSLIFLECNLQLLLGVHHDRAVPGYRLPQRLAGDKQETHRLVGRRHLHRSAGMLEQNHGFNPAE